MAWEDAAQSATNREDWRRSVAQCRDDLSLTRWCPLHLSEKYFCLCPKKPTQIRSKTKNTLRLAVVASQKCEVAQNSEKMWAYSSSRSSKVINLGANRKRIFTFLLVICSNFV